MKAKKINNKIKTYSRLPRSYAGVVGGFNLLSDSELESYGFYNITVPSFNNDTQELGEIFFNETINAYTYPVNNLTWSETLEELKQNKINSVKRKVMTQLSSTDWYIIRKLERNIDIPENIKQERTAILAKHDEQIAEINSLLSKENVVAYELK